MTTEARPAAAPPDQVRRAGEPDPREQTRARYPDSTGYVQRDGVRVYYEVYGSGEPTVLLLPTWSIVHSRHWKMQIPYLAGHCRVVTFDGRRNRRSDRPAAGYEETEFAADARAVMDATGTDRATRSPGTGVTALAFARDWCGGARVTPRNANRAPCGRVQCRPAAATVGGVPAGRLKRNAGPMGSASVSQGPLTGNRPRWR